MSKHHPGMLLEPSRSFQLNYTLDLIMCRRQPGIGTPVSKFCSFEPIYSHSYWPALREM